MGELQVQEAERVGGGGSVRLAGLKGQDRTRVCLIHSPTTC